MVNMQIDTLEVRNIRCFEDAEFSFHPRFNLVIGENGSGKTALLEALSAASEGWFAAYPDRAHTTLRSDDAYYVRETQVDLHGETSWKRHLPASMLASGKALSDEFEVLVNLNGDVELEWSGTLIGSVSERLDDLEAGPNQETLPLLRFFGTDRLAGPQVGVSPSQGRTRLELHVELAQGPSFQLLSDWIRRHTLIELQKTS